MSYFTGSNIPGFMPDSEPSAIDTLEAAQCIISEDVERYIDEMIENEDLNAARLAESTLEEFKRAKPQECNVYIGNRVFWITKQ
jgi:hypothetical protein